MKEEIRTKSKKTTDAIAAEQREEILKQGREEGQTGFFRENRRFFRYPNLPMSCELRTTARLRFVRITSSQILFNVSVNCVVPAFVAIVIAKLTLETDVSFSILALFQKDL